MRMTMLEPPYEGLDAERLARWNPPGVQVEPLLMVRMFMRHHPDLGFAMRDLAWYLLDPERDSLPVRTRELVIARTCARCDSEYEWGIHQSVYGEAAGFTEAQRRSTVLGSPSDGVWDARERTVLTAVDQLIDTRTVAERTWVELAEFLPGKHLLELVTLVGWYLLNCLTANATQLANEPFAARFPRAVESR